MQIRDLRATVLLPFFRASACGSADFRGRDFYDDGTRRRVWQTGGNESRSFTSDLAGNPAEILLAWPHAVDARVSMPYDDIHKRLTATRADLEPGRFARAYGYENFRDQVLRRST